MALHAPFTAIVAGPTGCGKSFCVFNLIRRANEICDNPPVKIIYCYGQWQKSFENINSERVDFHEGIIDVDSDIPKDGAHRWIVIDDLMDELAGASSTRSLFTKKSHHMNLSVLFLIQNLFHADVRTVSLNTHYFFLFKNPRDSSGVGALAKQCFAGKVPFVMRCFGLATHEPFSYLMIDLKQQTNERLRLVGNFASESQPATVYQEAVGYKGGRRSRV